MFFANQILNRGGKPIRSRNYMSTVHIEQTDGIQPYLIINFDVRDSGRQAIDRFSVISMNPAELDLFLEETWNPAVEIVSIQYAYHDADVSRGYTIQDVMKIVSFPSTSSASAHEGALSGSNHRYYLLDGSSRCTAPEIERVAGGRVIWCDEDLED